MKTIRIVILAKAPLPGMAKTRLIPALGETGSALLARRMLLHAVSAALAARLGEVELCVAPSAVHPLWASLKLPARVTITQQCEGNIGQRMAAVAERVVQGGESVILMGTDCPALDGRRIQGLARHLQDNRAVMLPSMDGGYVALGLDCYDERIFKDIAWSTDTVAELTLRRLMQLKLSCYRDAKLPDIDVPDDLCYLPAGWTDALDPTMDFNSVMG